MSSATPSGPRPTRVGPSVVRIGRGGGRGCGVVLGDGLVATNAHNLRDRTTTRDLRRRPRECRASSPRPTSTATSPSCGSTPVARPPSRWRRTRRRSATWCSPSPVPPPAALACRSARCRPPSGPSAARGDAASGAASSTPRRCPAGPPAARSSAPTAPWSACRPTGSATASTWRSRPTRTSGPASTPSPPASPAAARPSASAWRPPASPATSAARSGCPSRTACWCAASRTTARRPPPDSPKGDLLVKAGERPLRNVDDLYDALDGIEPGGSLELTVVRGTEERVVVVTFPGDEPEADAEGCRPSARTRHALPARNATRRSPRLGTQYRQVPGRGFRTSGWSSSTVSTRCVRPLVPRISHNKPGFARHRQPFQSLPKTPGAVRF